MRFTVASGLTSVLALSIWQYYFQNNEKMDHDKINTAFQKQSQEEEEGREKLPTALMEQKTEPDLTEKVKPEVKKISSEQNQRDGLFFKPAFPAFSLDTVFFIVLIHMCGADLVGSISTVSEYMSLVGVLVELAISLTLAVYSMNKWKREKAELVKKNTELQKEKEKEKEKDREDGITTLMEVKTEMEQQRGQLKVSLEEVERERKVNKQKLQAVEKEITEREIKFEKPEELLKEKENLLLAQWKLDQTKKDHERQLLNYERLLEPIETRTPK